MDFGKLLEDDIDKYFDQQEELKAILEGTEEDKKEPEVRKVKEGKRKVNVNFNDKRHEKGKEKEGKFPSEKFAKKDDEEKAKKAEKAKAKPKRQKPTEKARGKKAPKFGAKDPEARKINTKDKPPYEEVPGFPNVKDVKFTGMEESKTSDFSFDHYMAEGKKKEGKASEKGTSAKAKRNINPIKQQQEYKLKRRIGEKIAHRGTNFDKLIPRKGYKKMKDKKTGQYKLVKMSMAERTAREMVGKAVGRKSWKVGKDTTKHI